VDLYSLVCLALIFSGLLLAYRKGYPLAQTLVLINLAVFLISVVSAWGAPSYLLSPVQRELAFVLRRSVTLAVPSPYSPTCSCTPT